MQKIPRTNCLVRARFSLAGNVSGFSFCNYATFLTTLQSKQLFLSVWVSYGIYHITIP